jgi:hypothetical protein
MGQSVIKNPRRIVSQPGGGGADPALEARVEYLEDNEYKITYYAEINTDTGTITKPTGSTILLDQFFGGVDAYVSTIAGGQPTGNFPTTAGGVAVDVSSFDAMGNFTLSGTPSSYPVALIYILKIKAKDYSNLDITKILDLEGVSVVNLIRQEFLYTSGAQTFTLSNSASAVYAVFVNGQELRQSQYTVVTTTLTIIDTLEASDRVDVIYSNATLGINPSYTKAETDTLFVPYIGATSNVDLGEFEIKAGQVEFDQTPTGTAGVAVMQWNDTDGTLDLGLKGGLLNKIGQQVVVRARNNSGSAITKGSVVKVIGVAGGFIGINLALGDSDANSATAFGIVAEDIADASNGFVSIQGIVHGLNTNSFTEGDVLYLSPTVAGTFTNVKPVAPQHAVVVGYVAKKSATDGHILMHVQNGYELDELHNVYINPSTLADNDVLQYESASSLWKNKAFTFIPNIQTVTSSATVTPTSDNDLVVITAQAAALTLAIPTGTPVQGQALMIRIKDNATARGITWTSGAGGYRAIGITLPTTTVLSKTTYVGLIYNSTDSRWDAIGVTTEA